MKHTVVKVPDLGGAESVDVIELTLNKGDSIEEEESILVLSLIHISEPTRPY